MGMVLKSSSRIIIFVVILSLLIFSPSILYYKLNKPSVNQNDVSIFVDNKETYWSVANKLYKEKVISSPILFVTYLHMISATSKLKAGEFIIEGNSSIMSVVQQLLSGKVVHHDFRVIEGHTVSEIIDNLNNNELLSGNKLSLTLIPEGMLYPDNWRFSAGIDRSYFLMRMKQKMKNVLDELWNNRASNLPLKNKSQAFILASIVEKETGISSERPIIASVFINRLRKRMKLQSDPTVIYGLTLGRKRLLRSLTKEDLKIDSLYNTYKVHGLPPTAIAIPSIESIKAVLHPSKTKYLYFVASDFKLGKHNFAISYKQHRKNISEWLAKRK